MTSKTSNIDLSVIIVNYYVEYFLEQCLNSVIMASEKLNVEVFVVDNNSIDGSLKMLKKKFPSVLLIENKKNYGFSKANNQAIEKAQGRNILLLNPDTVVEESTFKKVVDFMDENPDTGGLAFEWSMEKEISCPNQNEDYPLQRLLSSRFLDSQDCFPNQNYSEATILDTSMNMK